MSPLEDRAPSRRVGLNELDVRRQVARDLHDGPQQRLVTLLVTLGLARTQLPSAPDEAARLLDQATLEAQQTIDELRELVAEIHPMLLRTRGLRAAVEALASRAPLPVSVDGDLDRRLPEVTEAQAYFGVAAALTDVIDHADTSRVEVTMTDLGVALVVDVRDDRGGRRERFELRLPDEPLTDAGT